MSTTAVETHTSADEVAKLAHPKQSPKARIGKVASYVGMALIVLYCILPFYWMLVSAFRQPSEGRSTEFLPNPPSVQNFIGVFAGSNNFGRALLELGDRRRIDHDPDAGHRDGGLVRAGPAGVPGQGPGARTDHRLLDVPRHHAC